MCVLCHAVGIETVQGLSLFCGHDPEFSMCTDGCLGVYVCAKGAVAKWQWPDAVPMGAGRWYLPLNSTLIPVSVQDLIATDPLRLQQQMDRQGVPWAAQDLTVTQRQV